jgi:hypothetical protein
MANHLKSQIRETFFEFAAKAGVALHATNISFLRVKRVKKYMT